MSAINWLSQSVASEAERPLEQDIANNATVETITSQPLDAPDLDSIGLLSTSVTGLPGSLWVNSEPEEIARLIRTFPQQALPALTEQLRTLLLAQTDPVPNGQGQLLLARIDALLALGALEDALALLEHANPTTNTALFRRWFDVTLLLGLEDRSCQALRENGDIAPSFQARIFCLARNGDWDAAALTLNSADALGYVEDADAELISRFLDPEGFEGAPVLTPPQHPTPLVYRMFEAIGEPIPTQNLPLAFSHAALRPNIGWKPRVEAAERLVRVGSIPANQILGIYSERSPAASGSIWSRVSAIQRFDAALQSDDRAEISRTLPLVWREMSRVNLQRPFAELYQEQLEGRDLSAPATAAYIHLALYSNNYELVAKTQTPLHGDDAFLMQIAQGNFETANAQTSVERAIVDGFSNQDFSDPDFDILLSENRIGEAILISLTNFAAGSEGDLERLSTGINGLMRLGLEDTARQASLQFLLVQDL